MVCGRREGERCYDATTMLNLPEDYPKYLPCGENLECRLRTDLEESDSVEAICYCNLSIPICGSDGITYDNECQFTEARYKNRDTLFKNDDHPCDSRKFILHKNILKL